MQMPDKILVVDSDDGVLNAVENGLMPHNIKVTKSKDWESALYLFNTQKFDLALVSFELQGVSGASLIQKWRQSEMHTKRNIALILLFAQQRKQGIDALVKELGDVVMLVKPLRIPVLLGLLAQAMMLAARREKINNTYYTTITPLLKGERYEKAAEQARLNLEGQGDMGNFLSALTHSEAKQYAHAIEVLNELSASDPGNMSYQNELAKIHMQLGNLDEAKKIYERIDAIAPDNIQRVSEMAYMYLKLNLPEQSISKFKQLIDMNPEDPEKKYQIYEQIVGSGFEKHAQELCRQTSTPKELVRHFNNKGVLQSKSSQYKESIAEYAKAMRLIPGSKELYRILYNMALSHINLKTQKDLEKAHDLLLKCLQMNPNFQKAKDTLVITEKHLKR